MSYYIPVFLVILALVAVFFRADFILILTYLLLGVYLIGRIWGTRGLRKVTGERKFISHVFFGEKVVVDINIVNKSFLPIIWLQLHETFPLELISTQRSLREVISLGPRGTNQYQYELVGRKRGVYSIGPLFLSSGDLFGLGEPEQRQIEANQLVVYPRIVPLTKVRLPSRSPMGTLRHTQPIFEDPSRVRGKREYVAGDSFRMVDWKATASSGRMQVKLFEPSIALETMIFLDLNSESYDRYSRINSTELAIVVAASLANWIHSKRQSVGICSNGLDLLTTSDTQEQKLNEHPLPIKPRKGYGHLIRILEMLARVQVAETFPIVDLLHSQAPGLAWGTTIILITPILDDSLFEGVFQANRSGLKTVLMPCGPVTGADNIRQKAEYFGIPFFQIFSEKDLDAWRQ